MSQLPSINSTTSNQASAASALGQVNLDDFLNLMITELQNQDPLNPLDNADLLAQISQIRAVGATEQLTATLDAVLLGQNISSATNLIGAEVVALNDDGQRVSGIVKIVTIAGGQPLLDLAVEATATVAEEEGDVPEGTYVYEVVWKSDEGTQFGIEIDAATAGARDFNGAIQLNNLPETSSEKSVYRTDKTGEGDRKLVGTIPRGTATTYVDRTSDANRTGDPITDQVQKLQFARRVTVSLRNVGEIRPPAD